MHQGARLLLAAVAIGGALALSGCSVIGELLGGGQPVRDEATGEVIESVDNADVFAIRVGDCLNTADLGGEITSVPVVPCSEPHGDEVYHGYQLTDGDVEYPGEDAILAASEAVCIDEFAQFVGMAYDQSVLELFQMFPTVESWETGDREVLCLVLDPAGDVTGSLAGAAR